MWDELGSSGFQTRVPEPMIPHMTAAGVLFIDGCLLTHSLPLIFPITTLEGRKGEEDILIIQKIKTGCLAQLVQHATLRVVSSRPTLGAEMT